MRAILDMRDRKVLRICGSNNSSMRTFAMLQIERDRAKKAYRHVTFPEARNFRLGIVELHAVRHKGCIANEGEFTIIHEEKQ